MIVNNSKKVEKIGFKDYLELQKWLLDNNVVAGEIHYIVGYCEVIKQLVIGQYSSEVEYVIKRFDGKKFYIAESRLERFFITQGANYTVVNVKRYDCRAAELGWVIEVLDKNKNARAQHIPSTSMILEYLDEIYNYMAMIHEYEIIKTGMKKQELDSLIAKLQILGTKFNIVDLNTIGVIQGNKLLLYTRQKSIKETEYCRRQ